MGIEELRIGSYINANGKFVKVEKIDEKTISWKTTRKGVNFWNPFVSPDHEQISPIELTEEILLKCGFQKLGKYTFTCDTALMQLEIDVITNKLLHSILAIEVKHLHQLQNLYWCLTNKDLNIEF